MQVPCVRVPRDEGEAVRQQLAESELLDRDFQIDAEREWVYLPVRGEQALPGDYPVTNRDLEPRERQTLPRDLLDGEVSYERLGDIALIDEPDADRAREVAEALVASALPVTTVLNRRSKIAGEYRVRDWDIVVGEETETCHREFGASFLLDVTEVYFSPRLATERHRVISQTEADEQAFDMFAGVGPFAIPMAMHGAEVVATDINPRAIDYLAENALRNSVADRVSGINEDVRSVASSYRGWADRLVMNLPHRADEFLEAAAEIAGERCRLHYYDIQSDEDPFGPGESAIAAVFSSQYEITIANRREVRSYAPHEVNVCLDVDFVRR